MKLDFSLLSQLTQESRGQPGTPGTRALTRVVAFPRTSTVAGTMGDKISRGADLSRVSTADEETSAERVLRPQVSQACPRTPVAREPSTDAGSPVFPLVPAAFTNDAAKHTGDPEAFEERAAIMEFDGGLSRDEAERLAAKSIEIQSTPQGVTVCADLGRRDGPNVSLGGNAERGDLRPAGGNHGTLRSLVDHVGATLAGNQQERAAV